jgi:hypothetical protein
MKIKNIMILDRKKKSMTNKMTLDQLCVSVDMDLIIFWLHLFQRWIYSLVLIHCLSICNVGPFTLCGTILIIHLDFLPYSGSVHPFSFFFLFFNVFVNLKILGFSSVHRDLKCSYRSLTSQYVRLDFLSNIRFTNSWSS